MKRKLTIEKIKQIPAWLEEGLTRKQIAEKLEVHPQTVSFWLRRLKWANVKLKIKPGPRPLKL